MKKAINTLVSFVMIISCLVFPIQTFAFEESELSDLQSAQMMFDYIHDNYLNATVFFTMDFALSGEEYSKYEDIFHKWQEETKGQFTPQGARKTKAEFKREAESFAEYAPLDKYKIQVVCNRDEQMAEMLREFIKSNGLDEDRFLIGVLESSVPTYITVDFDANCDDRIDISDAVLIMQSIADPDKYGVNGTDNSHITEQGQKNADINCDGITNLDALAIQKKLLKLE